MIEKFKIKFFTPREFAQLFKETFQEFFKEKTTLHSAALSYYTVLTLVPILYISIQTFGKIIGQKTMVEIISKFLKENIGITDVNGIIDFLNQIDFEKGGGSGFMQILIIIILVISSSALFNSMKISINDYFNVVTIHHSKRKKILSDLLSRLISIALLAFFGLVIILTYFIQTILISFGTQIFENFGGIQSFFSSVIQHAISIASNIVIFSLIFKYLNDARISWKIAIVGSLFTSVLLYVGQLLIKYYITYYFFARDGGIAGTILIILVWMFYSAQIIFLGAKFTYVYARTIGKPLTND